MDVDPFVSAGGLWRTWAGVVLIALANGCTAAPLAGKPCPCADPAGACCETLQICMPDLTQCPAAPPAPCASAKISSPFITGNGLLPPTVDTTDAGATDSGSLPLQFGDEPEQWVSYPYRGTEPWPTVTASDDGNGIHVVANFEGAANTADAFEGAGFAFAGDHCVDGTALTGVQFDFNGDLGGRKLEVGVTSSEDLDSMYTHGTCVAGPMKCYGPTKSFDPIIGTNTVLFSDLTMGTPSGTLDLSRIANVQWQVRDAQNPRAEFTITNVKFSALPPGGG